MTMVIVDNRSTSPLELADRVFMEKGSPLEGPARARVTATTSCEPCSWEPTADELSTCSWR
jgi:hypothetical protein